MKTIMFAVLCLSCATSPTDNEGLFGDEDAGVAGQAAGGAAGTVATTGGQAGAWPTGGAAGAVATGGAAGAPSGGAAGEINDAGPECALPDQTPGDCVKAVCDGDGPVLVNDFTDHPSDDGDPCTDDTCVTGNPFATPAHLKKVAGSPCGNGLVCDTTGACN